MLKNKNVSCRIANVSIAMQVAELDLPSEKLHRRIRRYFEAFLPLQGFCQLVLTPIQSEGPILQKLGMDKSKVLSFVPFKHI